MFYSRIDSYNRKNVQLGSIPTLADDPNASTMWLCCCPQSAQTVLKGPQLKNFETPPLSPKITPYTPSYPIIPQKKNNPLGSTQQAAHQAPVSRLKMNAGAAAPALAGCVERATWSPKPWLPRLGPRCQAALGHAARVGGGEGVGGVGGVG